MVAVVQLVFCEACDFIVAKFRIVIEDTVSFKLLLGVRDQKVPVVIELIVTGQTEAVIRRVVEVVFSDCRVVSVDERYTGKVSVSCRCVALCLEARAVCANNRTVCTNCARFTEARRFANVECAWNVIDVTTSMICVDNAAQREVVCHWQVDDCLNAVRHLAAFSEGRRRVKTSFEAIKAWLVCDQTNCTGLRARTEERTLWTRENLNTFHVSRVNIEVTTRLRHWLLVEIKRNVRRKTRNARSCQVWRGRREATNVDRVLTRTRTTSCYARQLHEVVIKVGNAEAFQLLLTQCCYSHWNCLSGFFTLRGCNLDGLQTAVFWLRRGILRKSTGCCRTCKCNN